MSINDSWDFNGTVMFLEVFPLLLSLIIGLVTGCEVVKSYKLLQSILCKNKLISTFPPYNVTHIQRCASSNIWGAVGELPLIMFEIRLYCFHTLEMQRGKRTDSKEHASEISITLLKWVRVRAVIICNLCLE